MRPSLRLYFNLKLSINCLTKVCIQEGGSKGIALRTTLVKHHQLVPNPFLSTSSKMRKALQSMP
jgi:hypothetical protein